MVAILNVMVAYFELVLNQNGLKQTKFATTANYF